MLACSGLDHAARGFETFARECFDALVDVPGLDLRLVKGSGRSGERERSLRTFTRDHAAIRGLARAVRREPFRLEQVAFALPLQRELSRTRPDVVYFSEWHTGLVLAAARRAVHGSFRLAYCNGATAVEGFDHLDRVQQLTPVALETVLQHGAEPSRHELLPLGFAIRPRLEPLRAGERDALRDRLGLPRDRELVLSVAALNRQKRIDYVIAEIARLPEPRPHLLLLGQPDGETPALRALAQRELGEDGQTVRTVAPAEVTDYYRASDAFVLASLGESFGRVLVEAMAQGVPCIAHDYPITRYVLGTHGRLGDLTTPGALGALLSAADRTPHGAQARHRFAYERFSWDALRPRYVAFLRAAAAAPARHRGAAANSTVSSSRGEAVRTKHR
jgi:glycosyltransferase involved in cell wall biosynthesis